MCGKVGWGWGAGEKVGQERERKTARGVGAVRHHPGRRGEGVWEAAKLG